MSETDSVPAHPCLRIRRLTPADASRGLELSAEAGWNQNAADWDLLLRVCAGWGAENPTDDRLIGTTMAWQPTAAQAWINMVLVAMRSRGQGVARQLMDACLAAPEWADAAVLLDATDMGAHLYTKLGFAGGQEIIRLLRPADFAAPPAAEARSGVRAITGADMDAVIRLDAEVSGVARPEVLHDFFARLPQGGWLCEDTFGCPNGFVLGRDGRIGVQLGPVVANSAKDACRLLDRALVHITGPVLIDAPGEATDWRAFLRARGFVAQRRFVRMGLRGADWPTDWSRYHAISGPDFA